MCNAYQVTTNQQAITDLIKGWSWRQRVSNQPILPGIWKNYRAPIVRLVDDQLELDDALWGMPTPEEHLVTKTGKKMLYDPGVTNIRHTHFKHWQPWLGPEHRCLVPFIRFSEPDAAHKNHYFDFVDGREVSFMAGVCDVLTRQIRAKDPEPTTGRFYGFLTTKANDTVGAIHSKAMPVILTEPDEWRTWLTADWPTAKALQRPLSEGLLRSTPAELAPVDEA